MLISHSFDSGNIEIIEATSPANIRLNIRKDNKSDFYQWFHFRLSGVDGQDCALTIENAGDAAYKDGWEDYNVCASYDRETWFRVPTSFDGNHLTWSITPDQDSVYFAYFAPYSMERHADLIADMSQSPLVQTRVLGHTLDGQDMDLIELGMGAEGRKKIWLIARQHPGETMAEWWMEGALSRLADLDDPVTRKLLDKCQFYIVPNMNPDGSRRGHLRTNAVGVNLNRVWENPSMETEPEVALVLAEMDRVGCDFNLDVHGDEGLPYNFIAGYEGIPDLTSEHAAKQTLYTELLDAMSPDFQTQFGYDVDKPGEANLTMATNQIAYRFQCLAMTLEMPFKDNADLPDEDFGWSPDRCMHLARGCLDALAAMVDEL